MHKQHPQTAYRKDAVLTGTIFENCDKRKRNEKKRLTNPETYDKLSKSSGNGHEKNMGVFPSGQWGQTVNLLLFSFGGSNPPAPMKKPLV